ncbi:unnamed protein product [Ceratitis capitata]|uniref:(Mediterranean fruit fly) hypothetical protein n=1 Tax=Ceratitis capitata TaxID=7213 RepID=A0A811UNY3_CERCA|nr:unnamed protein product [Ceratitis capitata]
MKNNSATIGLTNCSSSSGSNSRSGTNSSNNNNNSNNGSSCGNVPISTAAISFFATALNNTISQQHISKSNKSCETNITDSCSGSSSNSHRRANNCSNQLSSIIESLSNGGSSCNSNINSDSLAAVRLGLGLNLGFGSKNIPTSALTSTAFSAGDSGGSLEAANNITAAFLPTTTATFKTYPAINSAYWLPSPNPSPYTVPALKQFISKPNKAQSTF